MNECSGLCRLSEDDTIFLERTASTFGNVVYRRSGVGAPERFYYLDFINEITANITHIRHHAAQMYKSP